MLDDFIVTDSRQPGVMLGTCKGVTMLGCFLFGLFVPTSIETSASTMHDQDNKYAVNINLETGNVSQRGLWLLPDPQGDGWQLYLSHKSLFSSYTASDTDCEHSKFGLLVPAVFDQRPCPRTDGTYSNLKVRAQICINASQLQSKASLNINEPDTQVAEAVYGKTQ